MNTPTNSVRGRTLATCLLVAGLALGPGAAGMAGPPQRIAPLPPLNAQVAGFARSHLGEPVGDGICVTLAIEALRSAGARHLPLSDSPGEYIWGEPVPNFKDVLPGDILQFRDAVFSGSRHVRNRWEKWHDTYPHHTAIVVETAENGRLITICHQNVTRKGEDPARAGQIREAILRMNSLQKGGQVRAYRPVALRSQPEPDRPGLDDH